MHPVFITLTLLSSSLLIPVQGFATSTQPVDPVSYSLGVRFGQNLTKQGLQVNPDVFARGLKDALSGTKLLLSAEEMQRVLAELQEDLIAQQSQKRSQARVENKKTSQDFLKKNQQQPGMVVLPSGLQYRVLKEGAGAKPKATDMVVTHYRGTLIDGTEFDSSYQRGEPTTFPVQAVIPGWTEALQLMSVGAKWQIVVPSELAYGESGVGEIIGPNETLIFELELLDIVTP